jgi:hypothetical protein
VSDQDLRDAAVRVDLTRGLATVAADHQRDPAPEDAGMVRVAADLKLAQVELLAIALAAAVEEDPFVGRVITRAQTPYGASRPTLGLLAHAFADAVTSEQAVMPALITGAAVHTGWLSVLNEGSPLPERALTVPAPLCLAMSGYDEVWPGMTIGVGESARVPLHVTAVAQARQHAQALRAGAARALVLRTSSPAEGRAVALAIGEALDRRPLFVETDQVAGLGPLLLLRRLLPVFCYDLGPGERRQLPELRGYAGPALIVCGHDGSIEGGLGAAASWTLPMPSRLERQALWVSALGTSSDAATLASELSTDYRHSAGRIAYLGRLARHHAALAGHPAPDRDDIVAAAWTGEGGGLDALAQPLRAQIPDQALVASPRLRADLDALLARCRVRERLVEGLGASATARYQPGVRALFTGPSGTGKTLAAGWVATRLGLPLYRVDLASVTSKYIGETEKNLSQLLARAEQAEVILLFDEADSMFGKRTEISDANDRFANAQTNYLLQRIEQYDGIVLLTSNSQARFDEAFARRLDFVVEFPLPGPAERRALWESHLGDTTLTPQELNELSVLVDVNGGQARNAVLAAAVRASSRHESITFEDLRLGTEAELRKLGRQIPIELHRPR